MSPNNVPHHPLGRDGPLVPALGQGLMGPSTAYGEPLEEEKVFEILDKAYEIGSRFWDTADSYGTSEQIVGKWFKKTGKRSDIFLATKFAITWDADGMHVNSSPEYAREACEKSLKELGIESIDLYYMHMADNKTPIEETMRGLADLKAEGKIKNIGLSMVSAKALRRAVKIAPVAALQVDYSLFARDIESESGPVESNILSTCRELGVALVAATPLGRGLMTTTFQDGKPLGDDKDYRPGFPRFQGDNQKHNAELVSKVQAFADKKGCSLPQLTLAWLLKQGDDIFPIPGTRRPQYLEQNFASLDIKLSDAEEAEIRRYVESVEIAGVLVPEGYQHLIYVDTVEPST